MSDLTIKITAKDVSEEKFFFKEIGTGQYKGEDIRLMIEPSSSHDAIIMFRGKKYRVGVADIANAICDQVVADDEKIAYSICDRCAQEIEEDDINFGPPGEWEGASLCPDCYAEEVE